MAAMAPAGAQDAPPYTFAVKNQRVEWASVLGFDVRPFLSGANVSPADLAALDDVASRVEVARIESEPGVAPEEMTERLARLAVVLQLSSEYQGMRAEDLQAAVAKKDEELDLMDEQIEQLERGGGRSDLGLEREVETARARAEDAERRVSLMGQELDVLKEQLDRAKLETREERRKLEEASAASRRAEDDVKELTEQLAAERQKNSTRQREDATAQSRAKERNQEVSRYQKENRLLAEENEKLNAKIESLMAECVNYSEIIVTMDDAAQAWRGREADVEAAAEGLRRERDKLAAQLETARMDLDERAGLLQVFEEKFTEEHAKWETERARMQEDIKSLRSSGAVADARGSLGAEASAALGSPRRRDALRQAHATQRNAPHPDDPRYVEELEAEVTRSSATCACSSSRRTTSSRRTSGARWTSR